MFSFFGWSSSLLTQDAINNKQAEVNALVKTLEDDRVCFLRAQEEEEETFKKQQEERQRKFYDQQSIKKQIFEVQQETSDRNIRQQQEFINEQQEALQIRDRLKEIQKKIQVLETEIEEIQLNSVRDNDKTREIVKQVIDMVKHIEEKEAGIREKYERDKEFLCDDQSRDYQIISECLRKIIKNERIARKWDEYSDLTKSETNKRNETRGKYSGSALVKTVLKDIDSQDPTELENLEREFDLRLSELTDSKPLLESVGQSYDRQLKMAQEYYKCYVDTMEQIYNAQKDVKASPFIMEVLEQVQKEVNKSVMD